MKRTISNRCIAVAAARNYIKLTTTARCSQAYPCHPFEGWILFATTSRPDDDDDDGDDGDGDDDDDDDDDDGRRQY